jgi:hypothetical protein
MERVRSFTNTIVPEVKNIASSENPSIADVLQAIDQDEQRTDGDALRVLYEEVNSFVWEQRIECLEGWLLKLVSDLDTTSTKKVGGFKKVFGSGSKLKSLVTPWQAYWFYVRDDKVASIAFSTASRVALG